MRINKLIALCIGTAILFHTFLSYAEGNSDTRTGRIEAEDMQLFGYVVKNAPLASGGKVIQIGGESSAPIFQKASYYFKGTDGEYNLTVGYIDVFSGSSTRKVYVNDTEIAIWAGNKTPGASVFGTTPAFDKDTFRTKTIEKVHLKNGDRIDLVSRNDYGERGEFDYLEITAAGAQSSVKEEIQFTDVETDYWAYNEIKNMAEKKAVNGYEDGSFQPERSVQRDEFIKMFVALLGYTVLPSDEYWAAPYIEKAKLLGLIDDGGNTDFTKEIIRSEIMEIFSRTAPLKQRAGEVFQGDEDGNLNADKAATRAEVVTVLTRAVSIMDEAISTSSENGGESSELFSLDKDGYVKTWCATGMVSTKKAASQTVGDFQEFIDGDLPFEAPTEKSFVNPLPNGLEFIPKSLGSNVYVMETIRGGENDGVYNTDGYLATDLVAESDMVADALFRYQTGFYEMWCNGEKVVTASWKYTPTQSVGVSLNLKKGVNRIFVRIQNGGNRNALSTVGLQIMSGADKIKTTLPLERKTIVDFYNAEQWMQNFSITKEGNLKATSAPVSDTYIEIDSKLYQWPKYESVFDFDTAAGSRPMYFTVSLSVGETGMIRKIQVRNNVDYSNRDNQSVQQRQEEYAKYLFENKVSEGYCLGSELSLKCYYGEPLTVEDNKRILAELKSIDSMMDCSDFNLMHMLRLYKLYGDQMDNEVKAAYRNTLLNFAYWSDEEDSGRMVFTSENHKIGFYSCMLIAGNLFPDEVFSRSKRTGKQQAEIAEQRLEDWISTIERDGFEEFQSSAYMDVTLTGMLNTYDFSNIPNIKSRIGVLIDLMLRMTAVNTFDGVSVGVQGRVYREVIDTESCVKQRMSGYLSPKVAWTSPSLWMVPMITSSYQMPEDIETLIENPTELRFMQGGTEVTLKKTKDYLISAANFPSVYRIESPLAESYQPGVMSRQSHIMEASIGADARAFITHPGSAVDNTGQRPDYWYGQLTTPAIKMVGNTVMQIYNIPETAATQFTHAYWTSDRFEREEIESHWLFAKNKNGYLAIWCSTELEKYDDLLLGREYRANNPKTAWVCIASSLEESGMFEEFISKCKARNPQFDEETLELSLDSTIGLQW